MTTLNEGFVLREDAALKAKLSGLRVAVANDDLTQPAGEEKTRVVPVYFRLPEDETRRKTYPYITIDFITAVRDGEREHRGVHDYGMTANAYTPMGMPPAGGRTELPVPMRLEYQITQWSRFNRHDRSIMTQLLFGPLEPRFGFLEMVDQPESPDDLSVRRLDLLSGPTNGDTRDAEGKRLFRKMYTVGVSSELFPADFDSLKRARVVLDPATREGYYSV